MPNLTQPYETFEKPGLVITYPLGAARIWKGALVGLAADGTAVSLSPNAPMRFLGVSCESADPQQAYKRVTLAKAGTFVFRLVGPLPTRADIGRVIYAASDWEATISPDGLDHPIAIGTMVDLEPTSAGQPGIRVRIDLHNV